MVGDKNIPFVSLHHIYICIKKVIQNTGVIPRFLKSAVLAKVNKEHQLYNSALYR